MALNLEYDRSLLGKEYKSGPFEITKELIRGFCNAIGDYNPIYTDEEAARKAGYGTIVAPPTLCTVLTRRARTPDIKLKFGKINFHAGQMVAPLAPILAGDSLTASSCLVDVYPKTGRSGTMVFIVWSTTFTNQTGDKVAAVRESSAVRE